MPAGHPFCRECLARWQATSHLCPVCRADQRTLDRTGSQGGGQSSGAYEADEQDHLEGPSLSTILGLVGQLLARQGAGLPPAAHEGSGVHFEWSSHPTGSSILQQPEPSMATIDELQSSVQFVMARIDSLERRPLYWSSQIAELQEALEALDACRHGTGRNPAEVIQQVQLYTDAVNAQLDEFLTQTEAREQQRRATEGRQQAHVSQPSAPPSASAPPLPGSGAFSSNAPTSASTCGNNNQASQSSRTWQWGWGPPPAGTTSAEASAPASSSSDTQQTSGIGFGAAAAAAAALAAVGTAAKAAYRRATADSSDTSATGTGRDAAPSSAQRPPTESSGASQQQPPASAGATESQAAQPPVQGVYNAVRGIFDQHVSADSSLGRWGEVAHHLTDLHGQMNANDPQRQDVGRLLASAVNAYSAYRRATTSSSSSSRSQ